jgi:hypothetical protein
MGHIHNLQIISSFVNKSRRSLTNHQHLRLDMEIDLAVHSALVLGHVVALSKVSRFEVVAVPTRMKISAALMYR